MTRADLGALLDAARTVRPRAYAPYSNFSVGAAVLADNGKIYVGANVENASFGLAVCAERNAVMAAILDGAKRIVALGLETVTSPPAAPCGMCRQTLAEFADDLPIAMANDRNERIDSTLAELLPRAFRGTDIP